MSLRFQCLAGDYAVAQTATVPAWPPGAAFYSITQTTEEISLVCPEAHLPADCLAVQPGWRILKIQGPLDFALVGILATVTATLAAASISIFALSTFNTDYLLVKKEKLAAAIAALRAAGHTVES